MRAELLEWAERFPVERAKGDKAFAGSPVLRLVSEALPSALEKALPEIRERYVLKGSAGQSQWTATPWLAVMDPAVTTTVQEGYCVVYLLTADGSSIYLTLLQGGTTLKNALGISGARTELGRRAAIMQGRIQSKLHRLQASEIALETRLWRADLYEAGVIANRRYDVADLPDEESLIDDLREALLLYEMLRQNGGWSAEDEILQDAAPAGKADTLTQAKVYRQHRVIERQPSHSKAVKKALGHRCMGCDFKLEDLYGEVAKELIEAHHLTPLATLSDGAVVTFDPRKDFAVLCPNCHAVIHRMDDPSDLEGLRQAMRNKVSES